MKQLNTIIISFFMLIFVAGCGQQQQKAVEDITSAYPDMAKIIFENDYVKAVEFSLKPGDKLPLHASGKRAVYALSDYKIKWTEGGEISEKQWQKGDTHWHNAVEHAVENIGDTNAEFLVVTRTENPLPETGDIDLSRDASQGDSEHAEIIFENDNIRILEVKLGVGESQPKHDGLNRLIYSLTDYQIEYTYYLTNTVETEMEEGFVHWHTADKHSVKNVGDTPAHYVLFAFKD
jgi:quercetin dioxygenase-like cupin family protein